MSIYRTPALESARRYLFEAGLALANAARTLVTNGHGREDDGTASIGQEALDMSVRIEEMKTVVWEAHETAIAADVKDDETTGENR